ncbi:Cyclin-D-binding Myb-like transcription factor 1 [Linum perenne]
MGFPAFALCKMVNEEAGSTEVVGRNEEGNNRKKRKRVKGDDSVDSSSGTGQSEVQHGVRIEVDNSNSSNERRKKKKKRKDHGNDQEKKKKKKEEEEEEMKKKKEEEEEEEEKKKKKKKEKKKSCVEEPLLQESLVGDDESNRKKSESKIATENSEYSEDGKKDKKRKRKKQTTGVEKRVEINVATTDASDRSQGKSTSKRVSFAEDVEVFLIPNDTNDKKSKKKKKQTTDIGKRVEMNTATTDASDCSLPESTSEGVSFAEDEENDTNDETPAEEVELVRGKRFSPEEDELIVAACKEYVNSKGLEEEKGIEMILNCMGKKQVKNCWKEIGAALPWRPYSAVYYRAHIIFERSNEKWTEEEREVMMNHYKKHGADWKNLADTLKKHRFHVKDEFRRLKLENIKKGKWSQDEYQNLFDLVNTDMRMKAFEEERKVKYGMLRDNISWTAISDKLGTRAFSLCCLKWYKQLASPMVAQGNWLDTDDYRLVIELYNLDACCMEDVEWDCLLEHRSGELCRKRFNEMVKHLGTGSSNKSFSEQVEILAQRYCSDVLEAREAYYSKPFYFANAFQKRYQFWTEVEKDGTFRIDNVIAGQYNLYGFVPNFIGEYKYDALITITPGRTIDVGNVVYEPPRNGPTLWEIGIPDRTAAEFFIPDANPNYINKLYLHQEKYRQYGLWERYAELYPKEDLVYNVHTDDYKKDWFFAQVTRKKDDFTYQGTTWQVKFILNVTHPQVKYTLRVALATANVAELQVRVNDPSTKLPLFTTGEIGKDNTIARHGIHGVYRLFSVTVPGSLLVVGNNSIFLTQAVGSGRFHGLMYDYIRFEGPISAKPKDRD